MSQIDPAHSLGQIPDIPDMVDSPFGLPNVASTEQDPEMASNISRQALLGDRPSMAPQAEGTIELPGGWIGPDGELHTTAMVRELTGRDEEKLSRIDSVQNLPLFLQTMTSCALERIGAHEVSDEMLRSLLLGDREMIILGIRIATYGNELGMHIICPACKAEEDLELELLQDIPIAQMEEPKKRQYDVTLRDGSAAVVTPVTAAMQDAIWDTKRSTAEMKTATLERCVVSIDGQPVNKRRVQDLGLADRRLLLDTLSDIQPGPDYQGVRLPCQTCGQEFTLSLDLADLFR